MGIPRKYGLVYTGHRRTLTKVSNVILTGLTDQGNTKVTANVFKLIFLKTKIILDTFLRNFSQWVEISMNIHEGKVFVRYWF